MLNILNLATSLTFTFIVLTAPLNIIINESITTGIFPEDWKEAKVTPVLKKGCPVTISNYRPVSCLPAASKVLESVVCNQMSEYLEQNNLLPPSQHGFRPKRSTMTAWEDIQIDWANEAEKKNVAGILLWDHSAAFDTLDKYNYSIHPTYLKGYEAT